MNSTSASNSSISVGCCNGNDGIETWTANLFSDRDEANSTSGIFSNETTQAPVLFELCMAGYKLQIVSFIIGTVGFFMNIFVVVIIALYRPIQKQLTNIIIANQSAMDAVFAVVLSRRNLLSTRPNQDPGEGGKRCWRDTVSCMVPQDTFMGHAHLDNLRNCLADSRQVPGSCLSNLCTRRISQRTKSFALSSSQRYGVFGPLLDLCLKIPLGNITTDHTCNMYYLAKQDGIPDSRYLYRDHTILCIPLCIFIVCYSKNGIGVAQKSWTCKWLRRSPYKKREHGSCQIKRLQDHGTCFFPFCPLLDDESNVLVSLTIWASASTRSSDFYNSTVAMIFINCCTTPIVYIVKYESFQKGIRHVFFCNRIHPTNDDNNLQTNDHGIHQPRILTLFNGVASAIRGSANNL